jgi:hypothetical protein
MIYSFKYQDYEELFSTKNSEMFQRMGPRNGTKGKSGKHKKLIPSSLGDARLLLYFDYTVKGNNN